MVKNMLVNGKIIYLMAMGPYNFQMGKFIKEIF